MSFYCPLFEGIFIVEKSITESSQFYGCSLTTAVCFEDFSQGLSSFTKRSLCVFSLYLSYVC